MIPSIHRSLIEGLYRLHGFSWIPLIRVLMANALVLKVGLVACAGVLPVAFIRGPIRGTPIHWQLIDCSFGVIGTLPLWYCLQLSRSMASENQ